MKSREEIIDCVLPRFSEAHDPPDSVREELRQRLIADRYFTCEDFAHLPLECCEYCHGRYALYDMRDVTLHDGSHAWVCDPFADFLLRRIFLPEESEATKMLVEIFGGEEPDEGRDALRNEYLRATTDEEKLLTTLRFLLHEHPQKSGVDCRTAAKIIADAKAMPGKEML